MKTKRLPPALDLMIRRNVSVQPPAAFTALEEKLQMARERLDPNRSKGQRVRPK